MGRAAGHLKICIVGASGKLGQYMLQHALDRGYQVVGVCRPESVGKLKRFAGRIQIFPGATNDRDVIRRAVEDCDGVLTVLVPWGLKQYASGTAQAVLDFARPGGLNSGSCRLLVAFALPALVIVLHMIPVAGDECRDNENEDEAQSNFEEF